MSLQDLPAELVTEVIAHLPTATAVCNLARVNRVTYDLVEKDGWKAFLANRFPSIPVRDDPRIGALTLTTLSRSWDRRALLARYLEPSFVFSFPSRTLRETWTKAQGQTMGFQPVVDSHEDPQANAWNGRREMLAWSAGAEILLRRRFVWGRRLSTPQDERWFSYKPVGAREGVDDVTALRLLTDSYRKRNAVGEQTQQFIYGTAGGALNYVTFDHPLSKANGGSYSARSFETDGRSVRSADISPRQDYLVSALGEKGNLAFYRIPNTRQLNESLNPICERIVTPEGVTTRVWSTRFLSSSKLGIGLGPSKSPVQVYDISPTGISENPIRKFAVDGDSWPYTDKVGAAVQPLKSKSASVYPIEPLSHWSRGGQSPGDVFLSGGYDGVIRLHDMRSPASHESRYFDPTDDGAIYSLVASGRERLAAGTARHSMVKFFDLRVSGGRNYWYDETEPPDDKLGWNLFLTDQTRQQSELRIHQGGNRNQRRLRHRAHHRESPVYSISSPSPSSSTIYAGIENDVIQIDTIDAEHSREAYTRDRNVLNLAMYDPTYDGGIPLKIQRPLVPKDDAPSTFGLDDLWADNRSMSTWSW